MYQAWWYLLYKQWFCELATIDSLLQGRKLRLIKVKEQGQVFVLRLAEQRFECQRLCSFSPSHITMDTEGMKTSYAKSEPAMDSEVITVFQFWLNSYSLADGPGRKANVTPEQAPKSNDKSHSGFGLLALLRQWDGSAQFNFIIWLDCYSDPTGNCPGLAGNKSFLGTVGSCLGKDWIKKHAPDYFVALEISEKKMFSYQVKLFWQCDFYNAGQLWRLLNVDKAHIFFVFIRCFGTFCSLHIFHQINIPLWTTRNANSLLILCKYISLGLFLNQSSLLIIKENTCPCQVSYYFLRIYIYISLFIFPLDSTDFRPQATHYWLCDLHSVPNLL